MNIRSGPGTAYDIVGSAGLGDTLIVLSRLRDNSWYEVRTADGKRGWVKASLVEVQGDLAAVPVAQAIPPTPTPRPTPTPNEPAAFAEAQKWACEGAILGGDPAIGTASPGKGVACGLLKLPPDLLATDRAHLRYVIRKANEGYDEIERCAYSPTGRGQATNWVIRRSCWWGLHVIDIRTGAVTAEKTFDCVPPPPCPSRQAFGGSQQTLDGGPPVFEPIFLWLREQMR